MNGGHCPSVFQASTRCTILFTTQGTVKAKYGFIIISSGTERAAYPISAMPLCRIKPSGMLLFLGMGVEVIKSADPEKIRNVSERHCGSFCGTGSKFNFGEKDDGLGYGHVFVLIK